MSVTGWTPVDDTSAWTPVAQPKGDEWENLGTAPSAMPAMPLPALPAPSFSERHPSLTSAANTFSQFGEGAAKGLGRTALNIDRLSTYLPGEGGQARRQADEGLIRSIAPKNTAQKVGLGTEQAAEFLVPGGGEEKGALELAEHLPALGRFAAPAARVATSALSSGAVNKLQGGSFGGGAALGGGLGTISEGARAIAPSLAESALGITRRMRGFGKTSGKAALEETKGVAARTIADSAQGKLSQLTSQLEDMAAKSNVPASTAPALKIIDAEQAKAIKQNNSVQYQMLNDLRDQLTKEFSTGQPIPTNVHASRILDLKRGIGSLETTWNPDQARGFKPIIRQVYNALDKELDRAVPGSDKLNQRISSLIPVAQRAESQERGAELTQRLAGRLAAHTGALAGSGIGAGLGYEYGGRRGALIGGSAGLFVPEILASTPAQMLGARALNSSIAPRLARAGGSLLMSRSKTANGPEKTKY